MTDTHPRIAVFIDASNVWQAQKVKGQMFDLEKLKVYLAQTYNAQASSYYYYTAYPAEGTRSYDTDGKHRFFTYLKKGLGFVVRKKELKRIITGTEAGSLVQEKGNMDVEMTIDAIHFKDRFDVAIFFTGDSDFLALVTYLRNAGKKVYIYSSRNNVSSELRTGADGYIDILTISEDIWGSSLKYRDQK
jgi:uncharacterized LabA/DUF88 family protein